MRKENNHMPLDRQDRENLLFSCISNSEKIESIERLKLKCASGAHTVQALFQSKTKKVFFAFKSKKKKFKVRSGCLGPYPLQF